MEAPTRTNLLLNSGMSAGDYALSAFQHHESKIEKNWFSRNLFPPMRWVGNAMLSVAPVNRLSSALGLTIGLTTFAAIARHLAGMRFDGKAMTKPEGIRSTLFGVMEFDPLKTDAATKLKKFAMYAIFSLGGYIGMTVGTRLAYRETYAENAHPEFLEDYVARTGQEQADRWTPLAAFSSIFGSSSGFAFLPIPGLNYAVGLSSRTVLMQGKVNMTPGLHGWAGGAPTASQYGVKNGLRNLIQYAANNPAETPAELEMKSFHILGQLFPDLKATHLKAFVNKIHAIRDPYLEKDGVPKEKKKELTAKLTEAFMQGGLEKTLVEIGLNPRAVALKDMHGAIGRMGNRMGAKGKITALQAEYHQKLEARIPGLPKTGRFLETAPIAVAPTDQEAAPEAAVLAPAKTFASADLIKSSPALDKLRANLTHTDRAEALAEVPLQTGLN